MSWYEPKNNQTPTPGQELRYQFQFYESDQKSKDSPKLKRKGDEIPKTTTKKQNKTNDQNGVNKNTQKKDKIKKKTTSKVTKNNFI